MGLFYERTKTVALCVGTAFKAVLCLDLKCVMRLQLASLNSIAKLRAFLFPEVAEGKIHSVTSVAEV